ncbi:hypothetical protein QYE76_016191 [Lolium multiflorum]|uniref:Retrotransposon gag domain-containing protein n=1 Tax=Lolium multiflorum TaxID=4521 RepID=A0AAD8U9H7_LOLMU|nr:hypothetical protein QYE76_016191 [Lolium multiflorum]
MLLQAHSPLSARLRAASLLVKAIAMLLQAQGGDAFSTNFNSPVLLSSCVVLSSNTEVLAEKSAAALWLKLESICMSKDLTSKMHVKMKLFSHKLQEGQVARPALRIAACDQKSIAGRRSGGSQPAAALGSSRLYRVDSRCPPVGFGSQHILARPVGQSSTSTTSPSTSEMAADGTPVTYEELPAELKKQYDEIKVTLEADLIGSFQRTRTHGIRWRGFSPQANSIQSWKQLEEQFHMQYHSEASESSIADLAQLRQKRGETVTEYIQRFRNLRNRCYSVRITEKEAVELAVAGLATQLKDMASQADYPSLAHMVQKLSAYEQRHPDLYQDKFKRAVVMVDTEEGEVPAGDQEVAVAEWTRGGTPVSCKWVKPPGPPRGFDFDVTKTEQIFDLLLKEKQLTIPEGLKFPTAQELNGKPYCKFHNSLSHATNDCRVWRQHIQAAIEKGRLIFNQYAMKVDTQPFPAVNMVEVVYPGSSQVPRSASTW